MKSKKHSLEQTQSEPQNMTLETQIMNMKAMLFDVHEEINRLQRLAQTIRTGLVDKLSELADLKQREEASSAESAEG